MFIVELERQLSGLIAMAQLLGYNTSCFNGMLWIMSREAENSIGIIVNTSKRNFKNYLVYHNSLQLKCVCESFEELEREILELL